jgi:hypothetical protein
MTLTWVFGGFVLIAGGFATAMVPRWRARELRRRTAWSSARAAIHSAAVSRDAAPVRVEEAERLMARAESIAADRGGPEAAETAADYAKRADWMWRRSVDG